MKFKNDTSESTKSTYSSSDIPVELNFCNNSYCQLRELKAKREETNLVDDDRCYPCGMPRVDKGAQINVSLKTHFMDAKRYHKNKLLHNRTYSFVCNSYTIRLRPLALFIDHCHKLCRARRQKQRVVKQYSFDFSLDSSSNIEEKIHQIFSKYPNVARLAELEGCKCICECTKTHKDDDFTSRTNKTVDSEHHTNISRRLNGTSPGRRRQKRTKTEVEATGYKHKSKEQKNSSLEELRRKRNANQYDFEAPLNMYSYENWDKVVQCKCVCTSNQAEAQVSLRNIQSDGHTQVAVAQFPKDDCDCRHKEVQAGFTAERHAGTQYDGCYCCQKEVQTDITVERNAGTGTDKCDCCHKEVQTGFTVERHAGTQCDADGCYCCQKGVQTDVTVEWDAGTQFETEKCYCCHKEVQTSFTVELCESGECSCSHKEVQTRAETNGVSLQTDKMADGNKDIQTGTSTIKSFSRSSSSCSTESISGSMNSCLCCKRKNATDKHLYALGKQLSCEAYPLCRPCYYQYQRGNCATNYFDVKRICNCYTVVRTKTLNGIKEVINEINDLDDHECGCGNAASRYSSNCCKCKRKKKNGLSYRIVFDDEVKKKNKHKKKRYLEETRTKTPHRKHKRNRIKQLEDSETTTDRTKRRYSLQDQLRQNRPDFVKEAEARRKTLQHARSQREEMSDDKKLMFLKKCQENCEKNLQRLFAKEAKKWK